MANDINVAISGNPIKNGTTVTTTTPTGAYNTLNSYVKNTPALTDIENKYDDRFDDIIYYTIGSNTLIGA